LIQFRKLLKPIYRKSRQIQITVPSATPEVMYAMQSKAKANIGRPSFLKDVMKKAVLGHYRYALVNLP
jgi:hypothetical protein